LLAAALLVVCSDRSSQAQAKARPAPAPAAAASAAPAAATAPPSTPCPNPPPCTGTTGKCANNPYVPTLCWTTPYGPPRADVVSSPKNLLYCNGGAYALCFFSGPPNPTGQNPANKRLPCTLQQGGVAICTCEAFSCGPYFVDINGILNQGVYYQTVNACGQDGSGCANLENCGPKGDRQGCRDQKTAPVCGYVKNQDPANASVSLIPRADLISTFSFAMDSDYALGTTPCTTTPGLYAGCMTAPCYFGPNHKSPLINGEPIQCECPVYSGPYQIGQDHQTCAIPQSGQASFVWSASYNPGSSSKQPQ
jgi:hypothetical protein